jgi:hypothetical protein
LHSGQEYKCKIRPEKSGLISKTINSEYFPKDNLFFDKVINFGELKFLPAIDFAAQSSCKAYIDDLVFALYFSVPLTTVSFAAASDIRKACAENEFYGVIGGEGDEAVEGNK